MNLETTLEAVLELIGWQAELVRAALRQVRRQASRANRRSKGKAARPR